MTTEPMMHASFTATHSRHGLLQWLVGTAILACCAMLACQAQAQDAVRTESPTVAAHRQAVDQARKLARELVDTHNLPGLSVAVGLDDGVVWAQGFGWANIEEQVPVSPLTRFRIGSVSKSLTSVAVGLL